VAVSVGEDSGAVIVGVGSRTRAAAPLFAGSACKEPPPSRHTQAFVASSSQKPSRKLGREGCAAARKLLQNVVDWSGKSRRALTALSSEGQVSSVTLQLGSGIPICRSRTEKIPALYDETWVT
jgi:hypothetical protein